MKLSPKKCQFFQKETCYLGHVISADGIKTDPTKIRAISTWPVPKDVHELRSFLGLCSYYRRFMKGFSVTAAPLHRLTESKEKFVWTGSWQEAFNKLKEALSSAPVLAYSQPDQPFILDTDASNTGIWAVLSQVQDGQEKVIAYFSKSLSETERNSCVTRKELLAVVKAVEHFHHYLYGQKFLVRTDPGALRLLMSFRNPEDQTARWIQRLQEYHFTIEHRSSCSHRNADALSRRPCAADCKSCSRAEVKFCPLPALEACEDNATLVSEEQIDQWSPSDLRCAQSEESDIGPILRWKILRYPTILGGCTAFRSHYEELLGPMGQSGAA
ncbi:hypothetical protein JGG64_23060 [Salmonella enterica subsp. enterica serovar Derby]|nr:hypothetical protein [Salmonella enterica subsp. enterica serovar Derby]